jgi:hypothetical protein
MDPSAAAVVAAAVSALRSRSDVEIVDVALPDWFAELVADQSALMHAEAREALATEHRDHADRLSATLRAMLDAEPDRAAARRALERRPDAQRALRLALESLDGLLTRRRSSVRLPCARRRATRSCAGRGR